MVVAEGPKRVATFFSTRKPRLCVGEIKGEALDELIAVVKAAAKSTKIVTLFLWASDRGDSKAVASLSVAVGQPREQSPVLRRPIAGASQEPRPSVFAGSGSKPKAEPKEEDEPW